MTVYLVIEKQYDENVHEPFSEVVGVFSSLDAATIALYQIEEFSGGSNALPAGLRKIEYIIESHKLDEITHAY